MNRVFLSLGSNRGDSLENIKNCMEFIAEIEGVEIINKSRIYYTKPMYNFNQKYFLNMVIEIKTIFKFIIIIIFLCITTFISTVIISMI